VMRGQCGICADILKMLGKIRLTQEERTILLERSRKSIEETTAILRARSIKV
jgi:hypothetical protein